MVYGFSKPFLNLSENKSVVGFWYLLRKISESLRNIVHGHFAKSHFLNRFCHAFDLISAVNRLLHILFFLFLLQIMMYKDTFNDDEYEYV